MQPRQLQPATSASHHNARLAMQPGASYVCMPAKVPEHVKYLLRACTDPLVHVAQLKAGKASYHKKLSVRRGDQAAATPAFDLGVGGHLLPLELIRLHIKGR
eukprot:1160703-Pelagomonas_calceolata.AAC.3